MSSNAIYHHLIPQTYMKPWCFNSKTIWSYNKIENEWKARNIEKICGVNYYHSIRATSLYVTPDALDNIFGFLRPYHISLNNIPLDTPEKMHKQYHCFDNWLIKYPNGITISEKQKNVIKTKIDQSKFNEIEEQWSIQFENGWEKLIKEIEQVLIRIQNGEAIHLTTHAFSELVKYFVMFEWRGFSGSSDFSDAFDYIDSLFPFSSAEIPEEERTISCCQNVLEEMKHNLLIKEFNLFQAKRGIMQIYQETLEKNCTITFLLAPSNCNFITSDSPCFKFKNKDGAIEPFFVTLPNLAIVLAKKDPEMPRSYYIHKLSEAEVDEYNKEIFNNTVKLVLNNNTFDVEKFN